MWSRFCSACLVLLLVGRAPAASAQDLPGVRGHLYESPSYGFSLVWPSSEWTVASASTERGVDRLTLDSADGRLSFAAFDGFEGEADACLADLEMALARTSGVTIGSLRDRFDEYVGQFQGSSVTVEGEYRSADGEVGAFTWKLICLDLEREASLLQVVFVAPSASWKGDAAFSGARAVLKTLAPPSATWQPSNPGQAPRGGLIEVDVLPFTDQAVAVTASEPGYRNAVFAVRIDNPDTTPVEIDLTRFVVTTNQGDYAPVASFWTGGASSDAPPALTLSPGASASAVLLYRIPLDDGRGELEYATDRERIWFTCEAFCNRGPGGSPRFRTGN